jgi:hypothetical protein
MSKGHAVAVWHLDVADYQSDMVSKFLDNPKTLRAVFSFNGLKMFPAQDGRDVLPNRRFVINDNGYSLPHSSVDGLSRHGGCEELSNGTGLKGVLRSVNHNPEFTASLCSRRW